MKKTFFLALLLAPIMCAATSYVGINMGTDYLHRTDTENNSNKIGLKTGVVGGIMLENGFRVEGEITYRKGNSKREYFPKEDYRYKKLGSYHNWAYMINLLYDFHQISVESAIPYFGLGVGCSTHSQKTKYESEIGENNFSIKDKNSRFAYQGIAGIKYAWKEGTHLALQYHYFCGISHAKGHSVSLNLLRDF